MDGGRSMTLTLTLPARRARRPRRRAAPAAPAAARAAVRDRRRSPARFEYGEGLDGRAPAAMGGGGRRRRAARTSRRRRSSSSGNGYVINKTNTNPYQGIDVRGKVMVVAGLPAELARLQRRRPRAGAPADAARGAQSARRREHRLRHAAGLRARRTARSPSSSIPTFQQLSAMAVARRRRARRSTARPTRW